MLAAFASALIPGSGHFVLGQRRKAIFLLGAFTLLLICFWPLRLLQSYAGFCGLYSAWIALYIYSLCSAQLARYPPPSAHSSKWWLLVTAPFLLVSMSLLGQAVTRASGFRSFLIPSTSMERTIEQGDRLVVDTRYYNSHSPQRSDVIVFHRGNLFVIKRVIGTGGETIAAENMEVLGDGQVIGEPYVQHRSDAERIGNLEWTNAFGPVTVPDGKYFVMGDNRDVSLDSRSPDYGFVDRASIVGMALYVFGSNREGAKIR